LTKEQLYKQDITKTRQPSSEKNIAHRKMGILNKIFTIMLKK